MVSEIVTAHHYNCYLNIYFRYVTKEGEVVGIEYEMIKQIEYGPYHFIPNFYVWDIRK